MLKEIKSQTDPCPEPRCDEQRNTTSWVEFCYFSTGAVLGLVLLILFSIISIAASDGMHQSEEPDTHIRFSIVSVSVSELKPNASSSPEFYIVFQAKKAFENSTDMCLYSKSTNISYHGINIASVVDKIDDYEPPYCYKINHRPPYCYDYNKPPSCYNMEDGSKFVIPVPLSESVPRYLRKQLWEEREIIVLDLEMDFKTFWNWIAYHVWCNNVTLGAVDMLIPCNATIM